MSGPTLTEALRARGYTHREATTSLRSFPGSRDILDATGAVVFSGPAWRVWEWLQQNEAGPMRAELDAACDACCGHNNSEGRCAPLDAPDVLAPARVGALLLRLGAEAERVGVDLLVERGTQWTVFWGRDNGPHRWHHSDTLLDVLEAAAEAVLGGGT